MKAMIMGALVGVLVVGFLIWMAVAYNRLVRRRNAVANAWAQIDVQLKRRYDLIPNLVQTVKGYAAHERQTLEAVTRARTQAMGASGPAQQAEAENVLTSTLRSLFALAEAYPDLKANQNFLQLQEELTTSENRIAYARQYYNDAVLDYNNAIQTLPANVLAAATGMRAREYFEAPGEQRDPVRVSF